MRKLICISLLAAGFASPALAQDATVFVRPGDKVVRLCGGDTGRLCTAAADPCEVIIHGDLNAARVEIRHCVSGDRERVMGQILFSDDP